MDATFYFKVSCGFEGLRCSPKSNQSQGLIEKFERGFDSIINFNPYQAEILLCNPWGSMGYFPVEIIINVIVS